MSNKITSNRELAKILGVSEGAIRKAEKAGRIQREKDGSWNLKNVKSSWSANTDIAKQRGNSNPKKLKPVPNVAVDTVADTIQEQRDSSSPGSKTTYMQARTAETVIRVQSAKIKLEQLKDSLVSKEEYDNKVYLLARLTRDTIQNWTAQVAPMMAAELGVDPHLMHTTQDKYIRRLLDELSSMNIRLD